VIEAQSWFESDDVLEAALRRDRGGMASVPEVPGYVDFVELTRGGQGIVYAARESSSGRRVAIKVPRDDRFASDLDRRRFEREIDLAASLDHPNIVALSDQGSLADGRRYLVMDFIEGVPLDDYVLGRGGGEADESDRAAAPAPLGVAQTLQLFVRICDAIAHAHRRGIIHRDLKPSNIRVDRDGTPFVLDLGMAAPVDAGGRRSGLTAMTLSGQFVGSIAWASPEQIEARRGGVDVRTDVYALGAILYQLLAGRMPYPVDGPLRDTLEHIAETPPAPLPARPGLDEPVTAIVGHCLEKDPGRRYQSVDELARDVRRHLAGEPIEAQRESAWRILQQSAQRYRRAAVSTLLALAVFVGITIVLAALYRRAVEAEALAADRLLESRRQEGEARRTARFLEGLLRSADPTNLREGNRLDALLDEAAGRYRQELREPGARASVGLTLAAAYSNLGRYDDAARIARETIEQLRRHFADPASAPPDVERKLADGYQTLGIALHGGGDLDGATDAFARADAILRSIGAGRDREALATNVHRAVVAGAAGDHALAESILKQTIHECRAVPGMASVAATARWRLGQVYVETGRYAEAEAELDAALDEASRRGGTSTPSRRRGPRWRCTSRPSVVGIPGPPSACPS
jgi:tRNA A-37 threonylcarbamoyl transferase component Bud32/tetratricopeptide (TPR) repeat protein